MVGLDLLHKLYCSRLYLDGDGYSYRNGEYYGIGLPLYEISVNSQVIYTTRANNRDEAMASFEKAWKNGIILHEFTWLIGYSRFYKKKVDISKYPTEVVMISSPAH